MKIVFFGDSITAAKRNPEEEIYVDKYGYGYVNRIAGDLYYKNPEKYSIVNRGISGNRIVDLYARIKRDCWNEQPDVLNILVGVNDIWHEISYKNGVDITRFEQVYDMLLSDTKKVLPNVKIILCEPFVLKGTATTEEYETFLQVKEYAKIVKNLAKKYDAEFLPLQEKFDNLAKEKGEETLLVDGVHPNLAGIKLLADEWLNLFFNKIDK